MSSIGSRKFPVRRLTLLSSVLMLGACATPYNESLSYEFTDGDPYLINDPDYNNRGDYVPIRGEGVAPRRGAVASARYVREGAGIAEARRAHQALPDYRAEQLDGGCESVIRVRYGDTLSEIAEYCDVPVRSLMAVNNLYNPHDLEVGQSLRIPATRGTVYEGVAPTARAAVSRASSVAVAPAAITYEPHLAFSPERGALSDEVTLVVRDLPPDTEVAIMVGHSRSEMRPYRRLRSNADGLVRTAVRLDDGYGYDQALFAIRTADRQYQAFAEQPYVIRRAAHRTSQAPTVAPVTRAPANPNYTASRRPVQQPVSRNDLAEVAIAGVITDEGINCPTFRDDAGQLYSLLGDLDGYAQGDRVRINGAIETDSRVCGLGQSLQVWRVAQAPW